MFGPFWAAPHWPAPTHLPEPLPHASSSESPGVKNTTLLARAPQAAAPVPGHRASQERKGRGSHASLWCSPSCVDIPVGGAEGSEIPSSPFCGWFCLASAPRKAQGSGFGVQHRLLGFSHLFLPLSTTCPFPSNRGFLSLPVSGECPLCAKWRKEARRTSPSRGVIFDFECMGCFFSAGTHLPSLRWMSSSLGYIFGSGPSSGILPMPGSEESTWTYHCFFRCQPVAALGPGPWCPNSQSRGEPLARASCLPGGRPPTAGSQWHV